MHRRGKLTRVDRQKRQAKRERRALALPAKRRREELELLLKRARKEYEVACLYPNGLRGERAVCERCGREQPRGEGLIMEDGLVTVAGCSNCGHEYAETLESYA